MCETRSGVDKLFDLWATLGLKIRQMGLQREQIDRGSLGDTPDWRKYIYNGMSRNML